MSPAELIIEKVRLLPEALQTKVLHFAEFLAEREAASAPSQKTRSGFGILKGKIHLSDDFDAPLDEMKEYME